MDNEEKVLIKIDELRKSINNVYMRSRLVRTDKAVAEGDCDGILQELEMLYDHSASILLKLQECQVAVSEIKCSGGFSFSWAKGPEVCNG